MPRINTDEIVKTLGDWRDTSVLMAAGKQAVKLLNQYMAKGVTFNQETTLCGKTILKNIRKAKEMGYCIELHYVGVDSVEIAKERVRARVNKGGHGIPETDIEKRYIETFCNLTWQHFTIIRKAFGVLQFSVMERLLGYLIICPSGYTERVLYKIQTTKTGKYETFSVNNVMKGLL